MVDMIEIMKMFNLEEKPYCNLGLVWCRDKYTVSFVEDGSAYSAVIGDVLGEDNGIVCINNDVQQFFGMQPAVFSKDLEIDTSEFEKRYEGVM